MGKLEQNDIDTQAIHCVIVGQVQGVGFRPYIYRLAKHCQLVGWVKNRVGQVEIRIQGKPAALHCFERQLIPHAPPLAHPVILSRIPYPIENFRDFTILTSDVSENQHIHLPPDYFTCEDCLRELHDPNDRRYHYPFINCTQCGPRYTIIHQLPYDRQNTSMANFPLCPACAQEYNNPYDRRFHAQPLACPMCGPQLSFHSHGQQWYGTKALSACIEAVQIGQIVAVKGIGGYHLFCNALDDSAILRLRKRKMRPDKPFAVMLPLNQSSGLELSALTAEEIEILRNPARPIVLVSKQKLFSATKSKGLLSPYLAPGLDEIGIFLPYSPLHHLLLDDLAVPVVATSANLSGEPVLSDAIEVEHRLTHIADAFLHHNRPIVRPADDSLFRFIGGRPRPLRIGRGHAPLEFNLPDVLPQPVLAVGAHLKNTIALAWENRVIISPHIGDLGTPRSMDIFAQVISDLQSLYQVNPQAVLCDAHPDYASSRWAKRNGLPVISVWHHQAHASAIAGEYTQPGDWLVATWDGVGLGETGMLWGGELWHGHPGHWHRKASWRPFLLPGGDKVVREPWRIALSLCWEVGIQYHPNIEQQQDKMSMLYQMWQRRIHCPHTTSVGRLFDAAAAIIGGIYTVSFEGQAAMWLESLCTDEEFTLELPIQKNEKGLWESDWRPLIHYLVETDLMPSEKSTLFHNTLADALVQQILHVQTDQILNQVGLSGGVFQNRHLSERIIYLLEKQGIKVYLPQQLPCNDAAISFGQIMEYWGQSRSS